MRTNRRYVQIDPDVLERVRQIDLLSYLREFEPNNLVKVKGTSNVYCEYYGAAEPPVRCGESHLSGLTEPPHFIY